MGINIIWLTIVKGRFQPFPAQYVDLSVMPQNIQNIHFTVAYILSSSSTAFSPRQLQPKILHWCCLPVQI